jgi:phytoene dehydrogenase-like protein
MDRRAFLASGAALLAAGCAPAAPRLPPGRMVSLQHALGHRLRAPDFPAPTEARRRKVVIVGSGIGGLSAAWRLRRAGFDDFEMLELEPSPGGNARWGKNDVSEFPWAAHYLPLPGVASRAVRALLAELDVLKGDPAATAPLYDERALCHSPHDRHFRLGTWREGLVPLQGADARSREQWPRFLERMEAFRTMRGNDGRRAFEIPLELSSRDPKFIELDRVSMHDWLLAEGFDSEAIGWYVDYACRDDYGCSVRDASAWAGIHYFAGRDARAANAESDTVLTWPEGNGWLVKRLLERTRPALTCNALVHRIIESPGDIRVQAYLAAENRSVEIRAEHLVWAAPLKFAARAYASSDPGLLSAFGAFEQSPWLVANLTLDAPPARQHGAPLAWDNVICDSPSLGYVVATHQQVAAAGGPTVFTYYLPLCGEAPGDARRRLLETGREPWAEAVLADLSYPHPEIRELARNLDVQASGHAMVRPRPGLIWGEARRRALEGTRRLHVAHADASGLSIFEEAQYHGVRAAERVLARSGARVASLL